MSRWKVLGFTWKEVLHSTDEAVNPYPHTSIVWCTLRVCTSYGHSTKLGAQL